MRDGGSVVGLVKELTGQVKMFAREEVHLAKTEISEKVSLLGKNSLSIAIGGIVAYAGLMVFLAGLGLLLGYLFERVGLDRLLAGFVGLGIVGLIVITVGGLLVFKGIKVFKKETLAPKKTIETLQHLKGEESRPEKEVDRKRGHQATPSSEQVEASVMQTEHRMAEIIEELGDRMSLARARRQADITVRQHPYSWGVVAMGIGASTTWLLKRRRSHRAQREPE